MASGSVEPRRSSSDPGPQPVQRRVDLPARAAGFADPPCRVDLRFVDGDDERWTLVARTPPAQPSTVARWLEDYDPAAIEIAPGLAPKALRARFDELPDAWRRLLAGADVRFLALTPDGTASIFVEGRPEELDRFVATLEHGSANGSDPSQVRVRRARTDESDVSLTARQRQILSHAVALGYYEIPHNLTLRELADRLDLTVGTVSELLRRAESTIVTSYVDAWMASRWNGELEPDHAGDWTLASESRRV